MLTASRGGLAHRETGKIPGGPLSLSLIRALLIPHIFYHEIYKNEPRTLKNACFELILVSSRASYTNKHWHVEGLAFLPPSVLQI